MSNSHKIKIEYHAAGDLQSQTTCNNSAMTKLHPLFDTLENLSEETPTCVLAFLQTLNIPLAQKEYELTREFLLSYAGSTDTFTSYRREVERLLQWAWLVAKKSLKEIDRNAMREFLEFSTKPPAAWITTKNVARFIQNENALRVANPEWRPFVIRAPKALHQQGISAQIDDYQLSNKSLQALFASLSTYFNYLQQEEYLDSNPVQLVRQKSRYLQKTQQRKVTRKLSQLQWQFVINNAEEMATADPEHERLLFMMSAFYLLGLRISELAETPGRIPKMSDFAPDKQGRWWFTTVSKGNKLRDIAVPDEMLQALKRYRLSLSLSALPSRSEQTPLLNKQRGRGGLGTRHIRNLVQLCFNHGIAALKKNNQNDEADDLSMATVHWLRHTAISADIEFRPREHVRDDAGHGNAATTEQYIDTDRAARHASAKHKTLHPEKPT